MNIIIVIITDYFSLHFVTKFHSYILLLKLPSDTLYFFFSKNAKSHCRVNNTGALAYFSYSASTSLSCTTWGDISLVTQNWIYIQLVTNDLMIEIYLHASEINNCDTIATQRYVFSA